MSKPKNSIELPYTREAFLEILRAGALSGSPYSHKAIAEWCDRFWSLYLEDDAPVGIAPLLPVLADVDCQWDLHLANTYSIEELRSSSFEDVLLPREWFDDWISQVQAASKPWMKPTTDHSN